MYTGLNNLGLNSTQNVFSPSNLFATGAKGAWYDPSDLSTMFQDSNGTTPVTAVEQPVGLILDKSKGKGPNLAAGNGDFSSGQGAWTESIAGTWDFTNGTATHKATSGASNIQLNVLTLGKFYEVTFTLVSVTVGSIRPYIGLGTPTTLFSTPGTYTVRGFCTTDAILYMDTSVANNDVVIDNIIINEIQGNHASQATTTSRPTLSARYNLFTKSEAFSDSSWIKANISTVLDSITGPVGLSGTVHKLIEDTTAATAHAIRQAGVITTGQSYSDKWVVKAGERTKCILTVYGLVNGEVTYDLAVGTVASHSAAVTDWGITPLGNGWFEIYAKWSSVAAGSAISLHLLNAADNSVYNGDGTSGLYIFRADHRLASDVSNAIPPYQRVNTSTDYDTSGFPSYLLFDGIDNYLITPSIDFSATDKMTVFAGVTKLSDATGMIVELSADESANSGTFNLFTNLPTHLSANKTVHSDGSFPSTVAPVSFVSTSSIDLALGAVAANAMKLRTNGVPITATSFTANPGVGNFGNYAIYLGRRGGATYPLNGRIYPMIICGKQCNTIEITQTERYVASKTGVAL